MSTRTWRAHREGRLEEEGPYAPPAPVSAHARHVCGRQPCLPDRHVGPWGRWLCGGPASCVRYHRRRLSPLDPGAPCGPPPPAWPPGGCPPAPWRLSGEWGTTPVTTRSVRARLGSAAGAAGRGPSACLRLTRDGNRHLLLPCARRQSGTRTEGVLQDTAAERSCGRGAAHLQRLPAPEWQALPRGCGWRPGGRAAPQTQQSA